MCVCVCVLAGGGGGRGGEDGGVGGLFDMGGICR